LDGVNMLASNIVLPPGESVSQWVGRAVVEGLRSAGIEAELASAEADDGASPSPRLSVSIHQFWLDVQPSAGLATVEYRVAIALQGDVRGFHEGASIAAQAGVSAGGLDMTLWRRSFDRALEAIAEKTAQQADPLGPRAPQ
jgi:hypothetical protein